MKRLKYESGVIDRVDEKILHHLMVDARMSVAELARAVGMSSPSVSERIKRLEEKGVITGYTIRINPKAVGLPVAAWLRIRPIPGQLQKVVEVLKDIPEVVECERITGEDCFLARAYVPEIEDLEAVIDQIIPYAMTNTSLIQSTPVEPRLPPIGVA